MNVISFAICIGKVLIAALQEKVPQYSLWMKWTFSMLQHITADDMFEYFFIIFPGFKLWDIILIVFIGDTYVA